MSEKKVVGRNVAIALGIIVIILLVGLVGAIANYTSIINEKTSIINEKDSQIQTLTSQKNQLQTWLEKNITYYEEILNLSKSIVWADHQSVSQPANSYSRLTFNATYAGYISVYVEAGEIWVFTNVPILIEVNAYVRVIYSAYGVHYDNQINVGTAGTAVFPILPCSNIEIRIGNTNTNLLGLDASETISIVYYY